MYQSLKSIYDTLGLGHKRRLFGMQIVLILMSVAELAIVTAIPIYFVILDKGHVPNLTVQSWIEMLGLVSAGKVDLKGLAILFFVLILMANIFLVWANYAILKFSADLGIAYSDSLFKYYLSKDYIYHSQHNKSDFINDIINEVSRLHGAIIFQVLTLVSRALVILLIVSNLLFTNPMFTVKVVSLVTVCYWFFYKTIRRVLVENGKLISTSYARRMRYLAESFSSIKELKIYQRENYFLEKHRKEVQIIQDCTIQNAIIGLYPKYFFETLAFGGISFFVMNLSESGMSLESTLSTLSLYALSGYKLMPSAQQVFGCVSTIRSNIYLVDMVTEKIKEGRTITFDTDSVPARVPRTSISLQDVSFSYDGRTQQLNGLTLTIPVGKKAAFVGLSGSGKSTTANILLGLLKPNSGKLIVDGEEVDFNRIQPWIQNLSFVPQTIYLMDDSIAANLAFGQDAQEVPQGKFELATKKARIDDFIRTLPEDYRTRVGDDGIKISGGQKQRLGLARALFFDRPIIIMDEATSALDNVNESEVMRNIQELDDKTVIIIAHRLSTIKHSDVIFVFENGKVVAQGSYDDLERTSPAFQRLINAQPADLQ